MSLLDKTNIGIANKPLTVKYAEDLGWKIKKIDGRKTGLDANGKLSKRYECVGSHHIS